MLRDWGAAAISIERNPTAFEIGVEAGVVPPKAAVAANAGTYLAQAHAGKSRYHLIVIAAPSDPAWPGWLAPASARLTADRRLMVVAYWADLAVGWRTLATPCVEGTMGGLVVRRA
jgi:hypothetical protein